MKLTTTKIVLIIILISAIIRGFLASAIELGNDEVYYWTYALYPDWSHYDHPPMVGLFIQLFSFNLSLDSALFLRLASVISGSLCGWLVFLIAKEIKNEQVGLISVLLYVSSFYATVITGIFILPDSPLCLFWLMSVLFMLKIINTENADKRRSTYLLCLGFAIAFAILSKYNGILLWIGFVSYLLFYDRGKMKSSSFFVFNLICILGLLPILYWNFQNDWISFQFHLGRIGVEDLRPDFIFRELIGEFIYHNPIVFALIWIAFISWWRKRLNIQPQYIRLMLFVSLPLIAIVFLISLYKPCLPHWSGPAYLTLLVLAAIYVQQKFSKTKFWLITVCLAFLLMGLSFAYAQINYGIVAFDDHNSAYKKGMNDPTLDMFGWEQLADQFELGYKQDLKNGLIAKNAVLISDRWFPAAHLDYYIARPLNMELFVIGSMDKIHKYHWINQKRRVLKEGDDAYFITLSTMYSDPNEYFSPYFDMIDLSICIPILRNDKIVKYAYVYHLRHLRGSEAQKLKSSEVQRLRSSEVQKLKSSKVQKFRG